MTRSDKLKLKKRLQLKALKLYRIKLDNPYQTIGMLSTQNEE